MRTLHFTVAAFAVGALLLAQETASAPGVPVQMVVTAEARHGKEAPVLHPQDVMVFQGKQHLPVTDLMACHGDHAALELFLLIDDASGTTLGSQLNDLRHFIEAQPATTSVGVAYMQNATVKIGQNPTADHDKAAKALRLPFGYPGVSPSPFLSLSDLIKRWPASAARHEVVLVSSGIDPLGGDIQNPYLDTAIQDAQRAGVILYTIYTPAAGHFGHDYWRINWGQNHLTQIADETGGESYMIGFGPAVSFAPYLEEISDHLANQYLVKFLIEPGKKAGLQAVRFTTEVPNADLVAARKVYVPAEAK
ncbi:MAG TPA: hypothetical protein VMH05_15950 [Bryobacteraceae bacterium]|nr:hypothetical protein [Bryobacteraceae bacterium]